MAGTERVFYFVYWDNIDRKSYLYGANLTIRKDKSVHFENPMMPAGSIIQEWDSMETDTIIRKEPELPLLVEGQHYRIHVYAYADKEKTVIMRLNFFDRQRNLLSYQMVDEEEVEIVCPPGAYRYSLQLINAGMGEFDFQCILITTAGEREEQSAGMDLSASMRKAEEAQEKLRRRDYGNDYCGKLLHPYDKGVVLTVVVPPYTRRMVRLPDETELANIRNCVIAPVTILMPKPFFRKEWIRDIPLPKEGGYWRSVNFISYTRDTDSYVKEIAGMYRGGYPIYLENERKLKETSSW